MNIIYCYDAYCGWCYGFSPVMKKLQENYKAHFAFEVLSGGMILPDEPTSIAVMAPHIKSAYKTVEEYSGVEFGKDFLWHIEHPEESDWFPNSEMPAIALCILKEKHPEKSLEFASDLQYALNYEGRDLTDQEAYRHLLPKYELDENDFFIKLHSEEYIDKAHYEFSLVKQLQVKGYPAVLLQVTVDRFYLLASGYTPYSILQERLENIINELAANN